MTPLPNRPKAPIIARADVEAWLAEHGNGMTRTKPQSRAMAQARQKKPPIKTNKKPMRKHGPAINHGVLVND